MDLTAIATKWLEEVRDEIRERLASTNTNASGRTSRSLTITQEGAHVRLVGRRAFAVVETGRRGGAVPKNFQAIIKRWVKDKGISVAPMPYKRTPSEKWQPKYTPEERGLNALAGAIAAKIAKEGTKLYRDGGRDDIYSEVIKRRLPQLKRAIMGEIIKEINTIKLH